MLLKLMGFLTAVFFPLAAHALDFAEFGLLGVSLPSVQSSSDSSTSSSPGIGWGAGISLGFHFFERWQLEPGGLIMRRAFSKSSSSLSQTTYILTNSMVFLAARYSFSEKISVGAGPYWTFGIGNVYSSQGIQGYNDLNWSSDDFGFLLSFRYVTKLDDVIHLVLDERVLLSTTNLDLSPGGSLIFRDFQSLIGILFNL